MDVTFRTDDIRDHTPYLIADEAALLAGAEGMVVTLQGRTVGRITAPGRIRVTDPDTALWLSNLNRLQ